MQGPGSARRAFHPRASRRCATGLVWDAVRGMGVATRQGGKPGTNAKRKTHSQEKVEADQEQKQGGRAIQSIRSHHARSHRTVPNYTYIVTWRRECQKKDSGTDDDATETRHELGAEREDGRNPAHLQHHLHHRNHHHHRDQGMSQRNPRRHSRKDRLQQDCWAAWARLTRLNRPGPRPGTKRRA